ncbi:MAG: threonylcarbamoyl-AMP synthase [Candidatus Taylorbacteria bacterium]|nr:threonylcarbamoyl-AMP synthase [Candidatus Taylorbacteria bacterium]
MKNPAEEWQKAARVLVAGGLVVLPTDTIFGITARALEEKAVARLYAARGRDPQKACIVLCSGMADLKKLGVHIDSAQQELLSKIWPNPVSIILPVNSSHPTYLNRGRGTLAVRIPKGKQLERLLKATGPLIAPSANPEGKASAKDIDEARQYFGDRVGCYVGGEAGGMPSTLVELKGSKLKIIREGAWKVPENLMAEPVSKPIAIQSQDKFEEKKTNPR